MTRRQRQRRREARVAFIWDVFGGVLYAVGFSVIAFTLAAMFAGIACDISPHCTL